MENSKYTTASDCYLDLFQYLSHKSKITTNTETAMMSKDRATIAYKQTNKGLQLQPQTPDVKPIHFQLCYSSSFHPHVSKFWTSVASKLPSLFINLITVSFGAIWKTCPDIIDKLNTSYDWTTQWDPISGTHLYWLNLCLHWYLHFFVHPQKILSVTSDMTLDMKWW